jgi:hypothetical protein
MLLSTTHRNKALDTSKTSFKASYQTLDSKLFKQIRAQTSEKSEEKYHVFPMISFCDNPE